MGVQGSMTDTPGRRSFLTSCAALGLTSPTLAGSLWELLQVRPASKVTRDMLRAAAAVAGLEFPDEQLDRMLDAVNSALSKYEEQRASQLDNNVAPPLYFNPIVPGMKIDRTRRAFRASTPPVVRRPQNLEDVAFWPVTELAELVRTKQAGAVELTEMYLNRLRRFNPKLNCVVTLTEDRALRHAREADREIAALAQRLRGRFSSRRGSAGSPAFARPSDA